MIGCEKTVSEETPEAYEEGFVLIADVIPDAIPEVRYYSTFNFVGERNNAYIPPISTKTEMGGFLLVRYLLKAQ